VPRSTVSEVESKSGPPSGPAGAGAAPDEFAHIPGRSRRPPLLALLTVAVAVFLIVRLRHDVGYALSSGTPADLGDARALSGSTFDRLPLNRYVRVSGLPERESAVILDPRGSWEFSQLFRLHGAEGRLFVRRRADPLPPALAERDVFTGRLLRFRDLSFADSIAQHFAERVTATHFFRAADLAAGLARSGGGPLAVRDIAGEQVTLSPADRLAFDVLRPGEYRVELPRERFIERAKAEAAVQAAGVRVLHTREAEAAFVVTGAVADAGRDRALATLADLDRAVRFRAARDTIEVSPNEVRAAAGTFDFGARSGGAGPVPFERVAAIRTLTAVRVPEDAVLLLEGEAPRAQIKAVVILAVLVVFATISLLGLRRPS
jgi:hypothetical protein